MSESYTSIIVSKVQQRMAAARKLSGEQRYQEAMQEYIKALFLDKNNSEAYKELGGIYLVMGDLTPAIALYSRCLALHFDITVEEQLQSVILMRGMMLMEQCDWNNFLEGGDHEQFGIYLQHYQQDVARVNDSNFKKAHAFCLTNYLIYAIHEVEKVLKANNACVEAFLLRGKILWALNKDSEGNLDYWKAHHLDKDHPEVQEFLRFVIPQVERIIKDTKFLVVQNATEKCLLNIKKGLELYPNNVDILLIKSYIHRQAGEYDQALRDLDICLKEGKDDQQNIYHQIALTYNEMAQILFQKHKYEDSLTLFQEAYASPLYSSFQAQVPQLRLGHPGQPRRRLQAALQARRGSGRLPEGTQAVQRQG